MAITRIIYISRAVGLDPARDFFDIIAVSKRNNPARKVTGFLLNDSERYLQYLEGPPLQVAALFEIIEADPRHDRVEIIARMAGDDRLLEDWSMKPLVSFGGPPAMRELEQILTGTDDGAAVMDEVRSFMRP